MAQKSENMSPRIGDPVPRKEDRRLLTGAGSFSDDVNLDGQTYAAMVRSPHAHARIVNVDVAEALAVPGVLAVLTGADALGDGLRSIPHHIVIASPPDIALDNRDGSEHHGTPHFTLPADRARFVGEALVMVVGETLAAARDGAERVHIDYEPLKPVTDTAAALAENAPLVWDDDVATNLCVDADVGDEAATDAAFARAAHVVRLDTWIRRVTGVPMEPRAAVGNFDAETGRYTVHAGSGGSVRQKREMAETLGIDQELIRVVMRDVGGNFGTRNAFYPEFALVAWASRRVGRPVKWTCERSEAFLSDHQGRDLVVEAELALNEDGDFIGLRGSNISNVGGHTVSFVPLAKGVEIMSGVYQIPATYFRARATLSNTPSTNPYRSAGRPEVNFVLERLVDLAARQCGFDRIDIRRRNMIPPSAMPYENGLGMTYDSGTYEDAMDSALALGDADGFAARRADSLARGKLRGFGIGAYVETSTGAPRERTEITVVPEGRVDVIIGTQSSGQGHETSFAQLVTEWLGVNFDAVNLITGDTDRVEVGGGSHSGRSMRLAGIIVGKATDEIIARGRRIAACVLEAAEADIDFAGGNFTVAGTDRTIGLFDVAAAAAENAAAENAESTDIPEDLRGPLAAISDEIVRVPAYPFGCHVCEVEVDADTGAYDLVSYAGVDDVGRAINPLILHGQAHGGIVQGLGQAMLELCHYDPETGQNLSGSFMDYALPRADDMPSFDVEISEVHSPTNPLGIRAGGEGGTTPALAALINGLVDALAGLGVTHIEMPATPERVWQAIQDARAAG
jgi:aerobic carbon-monoxide dehydrogenase large subunit